MARSSIEANRARPYGQATQSRPKQSCSVTLDLVNKWLRSHYQASSFRCQVDFGLKRLVKKIFLESCTDRARMSYQLVWQCNLCGVNGEGKSSEINHSEAHREEKCLCGQKMSRTHLSYNHIHVDYQCNDCSIRIRSKMAMEVHMKQHSK